MKPSTSGISISSGREVSLGAGWCNADQLPNIQTSDSNIGRTSKKARFLRYNEKFE
jgi:hypothetical protein